MNGPAGATVYTVRMSISAPPAADVAAEDALAAAREKQAAVVPSLSELKEEFAFLGNWEEQCEYLMDLGLDLPKLPASAKTEDTRVHGCQSNVWMVVDGDEHLHIAAESDAMIVNGLVAVLLSIFDGKTPAEVLEADEAAAFADLGLDEHLSSARKSGLAGMVQRIRGEAARLRVEGAAS